MAKKLVQTHLKQNYVDISDLEAFLDVNFHGRGCKWTTLMDGSTMVEAPRKLTQKEIEHLMALKAAKDQQNSVFWHG
ncbi:hypothetical protein V8E51_011567 [Hyaloscypha variabilis]